MTLLATVVELVYDCCTLTRRIVMLMGSDKTLLISSGNEYSGVGPPLVAEPFIGTDEEFIAAGS